jgi:opacity protein-like surface antigen
MWIVIIIVVVACCAIAAAAAGKDEEEKKQTEAARPDAFIRLFSEEFPEFGNNLTFAKSEAAISAWEKTTKKYAYQRHLKLFDQTTLKDGTGGDKARRLAATETAKHISAEFLSFCEINVHQSYDGLSRAIKSSVTLAAKK